MKRIELIKRTEAKCSGAENWDDICAAFARIECAVLMVCELESLICWPTMVFKNTFELEQIPSLLRWNKAFFNLVTLFIISIACRRVLLVERVNNPERVEILEKHSNLKVNFHQYFPYDNWDETLRTQRDFQDFLIKRKNVKFS